MALSRACVLKRYACTYLQVGKSVNGLVEMVKESIERCPIDNRKDLFKNILLIGTWSYSGLSLDSHARELTSLVVQGQVLHYRGCPSG